MANESTDVDKLAEKRVREMDMKINQIESMLEFLSNEIESTEKSFPPTYELELRHLDILLETCKNFVVIFSTLFIGSLAINVDWISNINISTIRFASILATILVSGAMFGILRRRKQVVNQCIERYTNLATFRTSLIDERGELFEMKKRNSVESIIASMKNKGDSN